MQNKFIKLIHVGLKIKSPKIIQYLILGNQTEREQS